MSISLNILGLDAFSLKLTSYVPVVSNGDHDLASAFSHASTLHMYLDVSFLNSLANKLVRKYMLNIICPQEVLLALKPYSCFCSRDSGPHLSNHNVVPRVLGLLLASLLHVNY